MPHAWSDPPTKTLFFHRFWRGSGENPQITSAQDRSVRIRQLAPPNHAAPQITTLSACPGAARLAAAGHGRPGALLGRPSYRPSFERGAAARVRHRGVVVGLSPLPRAAALHQLCSNRQKQAVAAITRYAKDHVSLRAPFLLFSISSTPDRLCTSSVACPHLPPLLWRLTRTAFIGRPLSSADAPVLFSDTPLLFRHTHFSRHSTPNRRHDRSQDRYAMIAIIATSLSSP